MDSRRMERVHRLLAHIRPATAVAAVSTSVVSPRPVSATAGAVQLPAARYGVRWSNWAKVQRCTPAAYFTPRSADELKAILRAALQQKQTVKVVGSGHSPNDVAVTAGYMIDTRALNRVLAVDAARKQLTVEAGIRISELNAACDAHGLALSNLGSISDQSVAGAIATGTHGTGVRFGSLASFIVSMHVMDAAGDVSYCDGATNDELFNAARCGLGAVGIIISCTLQCEAAYDLEEVSTPMPLHACLTQLTTGNTLTANEHARFIWFPHTPHAVLTTINRTPKRTLTAAASPPATPAAMLEWLQSKKEKAIGYYALEFLYYLSLYCPHPRQTAPNPLHISSALLTAADTKSATPSASSASATTTTWSDRAIACLPIPTASNIARVYQRMMFNTPRRRVGSSASIFNFDCLFKQYVNEWAIPLRHMTRALHELNQWITTANLQVHFPVEVRFSADDGPILLSPAADISRTAATGAATATSALDNVTCWIGIIMYRPYGRDPFEHEKYFAGYEQIMYKLGGRPHWAKAFRLTNAELRAAYDSDRWRRFLAVRTRMDPNKLFDNAYLRRVFDDTK